MVSLKKKRQRHETDERESFTRPASVGNLHSPPRFDSILAVALADQFPTLDEIDLSVTRSVLSPARNNSFVFELKRHDERPLGPPPLGLPFRSPISWWSSDVGHHRTSRSLNPTIFHWFAIAFGGAARAKKNQTNAPRTAHVRRMSPKRIDAEIQQPTNAREEHNTFGESPPPFLSSFFFASRLPAAVSFSMREPALLVAVSLTRISKSPSVLTS